MTKSTLSTIATILSTIDFEGKTEVIAEIEKELNRGAEAKAEKIAGYDTAWGVVDETLSLTTSPLTVAEIWEAIEENAPEGFTKAKLSYALTHYWADRVEKSTGKVNAYRKA